tara:strand:+ start:396 stop:572 length:177 start_codon:yes stop_codon:yes gene_type:complete
MNIVSVEKNYDIENNFANYKVISEDNLIYFVPHDTANRHYQEILEWVANGGTIVDNGA